MPAEGLFASGRGRAPPGTPYPLETSKASWPCTRGWNKQTLIPQTLRIRRWLSAVSVKEVSPVIQPPWVPGRNPGRFKGVREVQEGLREDWSLPPPVAETGRRNVPREKERQSRDY